MPLYMDVHSLLRDATPEAVEQAKLRDSEVQGKYGVRYLRYWLDPQWGRLFCLVDAPSKEAAASVHREAHGLMANEIWEVIEGDSAATPS